MVSPEIEQRREQYTQLMRDLALQPRTAIIERVRESQGQLLSVLGGVREAHALWKPAPDEWCLRELTLHATFTERLVAKLVHYGARGSAPPAEDLAGAGIGMMPADDGRPYVAVLDDLGAANAGLVQAIEALPEEPDATFQLAHPFFGPLNCLEWAGFQCVHDSDHIQHAERILAEHQRSG